MEFHQNPGAGEALTGFCSEPASPLVSGGVSSGGLDMSLSQKYVIYLQEGGKNSVYFQFLIPFQGDVLFYMLLLFYFF